jgi:hypothetical protein
MYPHFRNFFALRFFVKTKKLRNQLVFSPHVTEQFFFFKQCVPKKVLKCIALLPSQVKGVA